MKILAWPDLKDTKTRRFTVKRACPEAKAKGVAGQPFARALEVSNDQSIQLHMWLYERLDK